MRARFWRNPTVGSKEAPLKFIIGLSLIICVHNKFDTFFNAYDIMFPWFLIACFVFSTFHCPR